MIYVRKPLILTSKFLAHVAIIVWLNQLICIETTELMFRCGWVGLRILMGKGAKIEVSVLQKPARESGEVLCENHLAGKWMT